MTDTRHAQYPEFSWWNSIRYVLVLGIVSRLLVGLLAYFGLICFPFPEGEGFWQSLPNQLWLDALVRFDSAWYLNIVEVGYTYTEGQQSNVGFFPLFPIVLKAFSGITGISAVKAALILNPLFFWTGLLFLHRLTLHEYGDKQLADRAVFYLVIFPAAFFFYVPYTESLFLMLTVGSVFFARKQLWLYAGIFALLASATRITGIVMWGVLGLMWAGDHGWTLFISHKKESWINLWNGFRKDWLSALLLSLAPVGLIIHMLFLQVKFGEPLLFNTVQGAWGRETVGFWVILSRDFFAIINRPWGNEVPIWCFVNALEILVFIMGICTAFAIWRTKGSAFGLMILIGILLPASTAIAGIARYTIVLFPVFMQLAVWGRFSVVDRSLSIAFALLQAIFITMYATWRFVG